MRTGSIGDRNVDDLIRTIAIDKRTVISDVRRVLLSIGYSEAVDYDPINVESIILFSKDGKQRFLLKHKWTLKSILVIHNEEEKKKIFELFPKLPENRIERDDSENLTWLDLDLDSERELLYSIAKSF